jgi:poly(3-hydroxybutyrate) depolymerase
VSELLMVGDADGTRWTGVPGRLPTPQQTTARWRGIDGCTSSSYSVRQVSSVRQQTWTACTAGTTVALYVVHGAGHVWPPFGTGAPSDYSASEAVWAFLSSHRIPVSRKHGGRATW